jgi:hypothetical protein
LWFGQQTLSQIINPYMEMITMNGNSGVIVTTAADLTPKKVPDVWKRFFFIGKLGFIAGEPNALVAKYGRKALAKSKSAWFLLQIAHPSLNSKTRSKYATVLTFVRKHKSGGSLRKFVKQNGGLNGCVKAAANVGRSQTKSTTAWGKPSSDPSPR